MVLLGQILPFLAALISSSRVFTCSSTSPCECLQENTRHNERLVTYNVVVCEGDFNSADVNFSFIGHTYLKTLTLRNLSISNFNNDFFKGLKVDELRIENTDATFSDNVFLPIKTTLRHLSLIRTSSFAEKWELPFLKGMSDLESLRLEWNGKYPLRFPKDVFTDLGLTSLKTLSLRHCEIAILTDTAFVGLETLQEVDLSYTKLSFIPAAILLLKNLWRFTMTNNDLLKFIHSDAFISLRNLSEIDLGYSQINTIQNKAFNGLENSLTILKLNNGDLQNGHFSSMTSLTQLRHLDISYNRIVDMHNSSFVGFSRLEYLDVSGQRDGPDRLTLVDAVFRGVDSSLRVLRLRDSGLDDSLPLAPLAALTHLDVLDVSRNSFTEIPESFFTGIRAKTIIMTDMEIQDISSEAFDASLPPNVEIIFDRNNITNISFILGTKLCAFSKLSFKENPIVCDCTVVEIAATNRVENLLGTCSDGFYRGEQLRHIHTLEITKKTCGDNKYNAITHCNQLSRANTCTWGLLILICAVFIVSLMS